MSPGIPRSRASAGPITGTGSTISGNTNSGSSVSGSSVFDHYGDPSGGALAGPGAGMGLTTPFGLAQRSVGVGTLSLFGVSASAPMTVLAGGVVTTYAATGVIAVPLSFPLLAAALYLFSVGYAALVADTPHAASFPALLTRALGTTAGAVGAVVALMSYNAIQIALYGLFGALATAQTDGLPVLGGHPWWAWAAGAWLVVTALGVFHLHLSVRVIGVVLAAELAVITLFTVVGLARPAAPTTGPTAAAITQPLRFDLLVSGGLGGVLALGVAAFVGFETIGAFREEVRHPAAIRPALAGTVTFLGVFYFLASWALAVAAGPDRIVDMARDPVIGPDLPFTLLGDRLGQGFAVAGRVLLVLSVLGAMVAFHNVVARYLFTLGREHALPAMLGTTGQGINTGISTGGIGNGGIGNGGIGGVPTTASATQSVLAALVIVGFVVGGVDPLAGMFLWLATLAAIGVLTLMTATCLAVIVHYRRADQRTRPDRWTRLVAPGFGAVALGAILAVTVTNLDTTVAPDAAWALPTLVAVSAGLGLVWAGWLRLVRPEAWTALGRSRPAPLAVLDGAVSDLEL